MQERRSVVSALSAWRLDRRQLLIPAVAAVVVAGDQVAKTWALRSLTPYTPRHVAGPSYFLLSFNGGAAFSLGRGITPIVETVVVVLVVWLLLASRRMARSASIPMSVGLGMLLGGALGNLADRVFRHIPHYPGAVVDFIQAVGWWPIFNVADACIVVGVVVLILSYRRAPGV